MTTTSDGVRAKAREAIRNQPYKTHTILSSLLAVQDALGFLPPEGLDEVARHRNTTVNEVWGIASFYPNFRFTAPAKHVVEVCWGPTCHVMGAQPILRGLLQRLGLHAEGDTPDGAVTLKMNTCLGVCAHAPAMSFDHRLAGHMSPQKALAGLEKLRSGDQPAHAGHDGARTASGGAR